MTTSKSSLTAGAIADYELLISLLNNEDKEFKNIEELAEIESKISNLREVREKAIKEQIEALTQKFQVEQQTLQDTEKEKVSQEIESLRKKLELATKNKDITKQQLAELQEKIAEEEAAVEVLARKQCSLDQTINRTIPSSRHDLQLYQYLTGIRWQVEETDHEIRGYVSSKNNVKTFVLDSRQNSWFFITNYLWDQLETDW